MTTRWLDQIVEANNAFQARIQPNKLPVAQQPGQGLITCMDPRINLEAIGIPSFGEDGSGSSFVRIIRTLGGMAEYRSIIVGTYLANIKEIVLMTHTDCGCNKAYTKIDTLIENMSNRLSADDFNAFKAELGEPFRENLLGYLRAFQDPYEALADEIASLKRLPFIPNDLVLHGLVYKVEDATVDVIVNGYA